MKSIEDIKIELTLKKLAGTLLPKDIIGEGFPVDDSLKAFICSLDPFCAYNYARYVDRSPHDETRAACCRDPWSAYSYAEDIDMCPRDDTREAACKAINLAYDYARNIDKCSRPDTREICYKDNWLKQRYMDWFGEGLLTFRKENNY